MSESASARRAAEFHGDTNTARRGGRRVIHPPLFYSSSTRVNVKVLDFVKRGGPTWTVDRTIFEMWLGAL